MNQKILVEIVLWAFGIFGLYWILYWPLLIGYLTIDLLVTLLILDPITNRKKNQCSTLEI